MPTDIEIAREVVPQPIAKVAESLGVAPAHVIPFGRDRAKVDLDALEGREATGKLILVTAMSPTPAGEGKTTVSVGLADGLRVLGKRAALALREPSMGPLFGMKGGAAGGGRSQVIPMESINLLFNGDFPAISAAHNLLAAAVDNALHFREGPDLDPRKVRWPRVVDMNDRALRKVLVGLGGPKMGVPREGQFDITAASEVMAILALAESQEDLRARLGRIIVGETTGREPVTADDLGVAGAMTAILAEAVHPNLVQTLEGTPALIHCGPFANIAHGTNSVLATRMALAHADLVVTEAGFGADLGAEKYFHIACRAGGFVPSVVVVVATARALKMHGGVKKRDLDKPDPRAVALGLPNLEKHLENISQFGVPAVVALNLFPSDTEEELAVVESRMAEFGIPVARARGFSEGGEGMKDLGEAVLQALDGPETRLYPMYPATSTAREKIETIAREVYGAHEVEYSPAAKSDLKRIEKLGFGGLPVCMAKTQYSFSDDPKKLGRPEGFTLGIRGVELAAGAGFLVVLTGEMLRMPGLPRRPAYHDIDIVDGRIDGLG